VHQAKFWYTIGDIEVMVRMQNVLNPNLGMRVVSADNTLPRMSNAAAEAIAQNHPIKLNAYDHDFMMDEISRRQMLDHNENVDDESSSDDSEDVEVDIGGGETDDKGEGDSNEE
jgi:hypothetical protein